MILVTGTAATSNSTYQLISAIGTVLIAVLGALGGLAAFLAVFRKADHIDTTVGQVHTIVNSQRTEMTTYIEKVDRLLAAHQITPPERNLP